ncbi:MAG TPA: PEP-CTERM sorting domain-containing protein [Chthoniobacterales bacterium]|nr:PEP-CTERM sorting domain-containing protein [Chthoniobacterales bacterium]
MRRTVLLALSISLMPFCTGNASGPILVDDFNLTNGLSISNFGFQNGISFSAYDAPVDALGGSRQAAVRITNNPVNAFDSVSASIGNGVLTYSSSSQGHGVLWLFYNNSGAGFSLDLTSNLAAGDSFLITFASPLSTALTLVMSFHSTDFGGADVSQNIPAGASNFSVPLSAFMPNGTFHQSSITSLTAQFQTTTDGATYQIDRMAFVPEPPATVLFIASLGVLFLCRRTSIWLTTHRILLSVNRQTSRRTQ